MNEAATESDNQGPRVQIVYCHVEIGLVSRKSLPRSQIVGRQSILIGICIIILLFDPDSSTGNCFHFLCQIYFAMITHMFVSDPKETIANGMKLAPPSSITSRA